MAQAQITPQSAIQSPTRRVTVEEYLELLDDSGYEVVDGELIAMTPQHITSSYIAHRLLFSIADFIKGKSLGDVMMETVFALDVETDSQWLRGSVVPDIAFISSERLKQQQAQYADAGAFRVAPDLAVEVVSPTDKFSTVLTKVARYLGYGVRLVWVIDPQNRTLYAYTPDQPDGRVLHEADTLSGEPVLPGWSMPLLDLFGERTGR